MPPAWTNRTDGELLREGRQSSDAFAELYRRHETIVLTYLVRRSRDPDLAADLAADTFTLALLRADRFADDGQPAIGWLLGIARHQLLESWRTQRSSQRALERVRAERPALTDETLERIEQLIDADTENARIAAALDALPATQRDAVRAFVIDDQPYPALARALGVPEATVRQRVSRGLARLRTTLEGTR